MGERSKIEWTDATINWWIGCTKVSAACDHCYAEAMAERFGLAKWGHGQKAIRREQGQGPRRDRRPDRDHARCAAAERRPGRMMRREFPKAVKLAAFQRANGRCEECSARLMVGAFHYDHRVPDALGGEPTLENCRVLCRACHAIKTTEQDVPGIAKAKRNEARHIGAKAPSRHPLPFGRGSKFKRKLDGSVVRR